MTVNCPTCGQECETECGMKNHHAKVHDESLARATYNCSYCGTEVETWQSQINSGYGNNKRYCSMDCRGKAQSNIRDEEWYDENMSEEQKQRSVEVNREEAKRKHKEGKLGPQSWRNRGKQ